MINCGVTLASEVLLENDRLVMDCLCLRQNRTGVSRSICIIVVDVVDIDRSLTTTDHKILTLRGLSLKVAQSLSLLILEG